MKISNFIKQAMLMIALCFLFTSQAFAWEQWGCRKAPNDTYHFYVNPTGFSGNNSHWLTSLNTAAAHLNKGGKFHVTFSVDNDSSSSTSNSESEVWWNTSGCSATAYGTTFAGSCDVVEADMHFSQAACVTYEDDMSDKTQFRNYGPGIKRTFETTAIHEIGHTAGLAHENDEYGIMGADYTVVTANGSSLRSYISHDMNEALLSIYGPRDNPIKDVTATHWRYQGASGAYSQHERTELFDANGTVLPSEDHAGCVEKNDGTGPVAFCEQIFTVNQGQVVQFEALFENVGNGTQTASIGYYLSSNDLISTTDTLLATGSITLTTSGVANTVKKTLTIPTNLNPNTPYFLGAIIDHTNSINEDDEQNNATYIPILTSSAGGSSSGGSSSGGSSSGGSSSGGSSSGGSSSGGLTNGQAVTGLAATAGNRTSNYYIDVPTGATNLSIKISGGTGDADLYVKKGSIPTDSSYDCRPYIGGNAETCGAGGDTLATSAGRFHINVKAYSAFTNVSLTASYTAGSSSSGGSSSGGSSSGGSSSGGSSSGGSSSGGSSSGGSSSGGLTNGQAVTGLAATAGNRTSNYYIDVPTGATNLSIKISGGTGDADLYVKKGSIPTDSSYDCRPYDNGNAETCGAGGDTLATSAGRFHINVKAYSTFTNVSLTASFSGGSSSGGSSSGGSSSGGSSSGGSGSSSGGAMTNGQTITGLSASQGQWTSTYYIDVPSGASNLKISIAPGSGSSGNADLFVKKGSVPTSSSYDCRPWISGSYETCGPGGKPLTTSQGRFYIKVSGHTNL